MGGRDVKRGWRGRLPRAVGHLPLGTVAEIVATTCLDGLGRGSRTPWARPIQPGKFRQHGAVGSWKYHGTLYEDSLLRLVVDVPASGPADDLLRPVTPKKRLARNQPAQPATQLLLSPKTAKLPPF